MSVKILTQVNHWHMRTVQYGNLDWNRIQESPTLSLLKLLLLYLLTYVIYLPINSVVVFDTTFIVEIWQ